MPFPINKQLVHFTSPFGDTHSPDFVRFPHRKRTLLQLAARVLKIWIHAHSPLPTLHCTAPSIIEFFKYYTYIPLPPPPPPPLPEWTGKVDKEKLLTQLARFCLLFKFGSSFRVRPRSVDCTWRTPWRHPVAVNRQQNTNGCFDGVHPNGRPSLVKRLPCILRFCLNLDLTKKMSNCQKSSASLLGVLSMFLINVELFTKRGSAGR